MLAAGKRRNQRWRSRKRKASNRLKSFQLVVFMYRVAVHMRYGEANHRPGGDSESLSSNSSRPGQGTAHEPARSPSRTTRRACGSGMSRTTFVIPPKSWPFLYSEFPPILAFRPLSQPANTPSLLPLSGFQTAFLSSLSRSQDNVLFQAPLLSRHPPRGPRPLSFLWRPSHFHNVVPRPTAFTPVRTLQRTPWSSPAFVRCTVRFA